MKDQDCKELIELVEKRKKSTKRLQEVKLELKIAQEGQVRIVQELNKKIEELSKIG